MAFEASCYSSEKVTIIPSYHYEAPPLLCTSLRDSELLPFRPQAVIFDLDGVILDTEIIYRTAWQRSAADLGYSMSDDLYLNFVGRRDVDCEAMLVDAYGSTFPVSAFLARGAQFSQEYVKKHGISIKPGLIELLDFIDARQLLKAVATSTDRVNALIALGTLASRFDVIVAGEDVEKGKPAPDILLYCAERLNLVPRQCLVLEDSEAGVQAASAAGMSVIVVPDLKYPSRQIAAKAAFVFSSLHQVKDFLMTL